MVKTALLVLEDGTIYEGQSFGADVDTIGEVVFNTSMIGYQEMLTDPSYHGQIVMPTYPLMGNYGINSEDIESDRIQVRGFIVREDCHSPSHYLNSKSLSDYLEDAGIPGITGLDTRAITRRIRNRGVMLGMITTTLTPQQAYGALQQAPGYGEVDYVKCISSPVPYIYHEAHGPHIAILDCGCKYNIMRLLRQRGCQITVLPCSSSAKEMLAVNSDGILLSPGPGNPEMLDYIVHNIRGIIGFKPIMGICLGNQLLARAFGGKTFKLKFGHRGGNHPVKDISSGKVFITAQNHGYAVDGDSLPAELVVSHLNLNDGTVEGIRHTSLPITAIQYHSEASPGPLDNTYLFDEFLETVKESGHC